MHFKIFSFTAPAANSMIDVQATEEINTWLDKGEKVISMCVNKRNKTRH